VTLARRRSLATPLLHRSQIGLISKLLSPAKILRRVDALFATKTCRLNNAKMRFLFLKSVPLGVNALLDILGPCSYFCELSLNEDIGLIRKLTPKVPDSWFQQFCLCSCSLLSKIKKLFLIVKSILQIKLF
jgi:hypothetical protein